VLTSFPNVRYRQGRISKIDIDRHGRFRVSFCGTKQVYDRVITRYGPAVAEKHQTLTRRRSRDPHAGSWLLTPVSYTVPTKEKNIHRRITPAIDRVGSKLRELEMRRESPRAEKLNKRMYENTLLLMPIENHPIYCDPQTWLSARLRKGESPSYIALDLTRRFWNF
jgi:hypothetical protein